MHPPEIAPSPHRFSCMRVSKGGRARGKGKELVGQDAVRSPHTICKWFAPLELQY